MKFKKTSLVMTTVMAVNIMSPILAYAEHLDFNSISSSDKDLKETLINCIENSPEIRYGKLARKGIRLDDKDLVREIIGLLRDSKMKEVPKGQEYKGYPHYISGKDFSVGFYSDTKNNIYNGCLYLRSKDSYSTRVFRTDKNIQDKIINLCKNSMKVTEEGYVGGLHYNDSKASMKVNSSISICDAGFARSKDVVLASADSVADSLSSAGLAGYLDAPILLSEREELNENLLNKLYDLKAENIHITSGSKMISDKVINKLKEKGFNIIDYSGRSRYDTSLNIAKKIGANIYSIANGEYFFDVPSIATYAYSTKTPILLTPKDKLRPDSLELLKKNAKPDRLKTGNGISTRAILVGGRSTLSDNIYRELVKNGIEANRLSGYNRLETSSVIIDKLFSNRTGYIYINCDKPMAGILASSIAAKNNKPVKLELDSFIEDNFAKYSKENSDNYIIR